MKMFAIVLLAVIGLSTQNCPNPRRCCEDTPGGTIVGETPGEISGDLLRGDVPGHRGDVARHPPGDNDPGPGDSSPRRPTPNGSTLS